MIKPTGRAIVNGLIGFAFLFLIGAKMLKESVTDVE
jgi:hypothetical protein